MAVQQRGRAADGEGGNGGESMLMDSFFMNINQNKNISKEKLHLSTCIFYS